MKSKKEKILKKKNRVRGKMKQNLPRLSVFRSGKYIYAQVIEDKERKTLVAASEKELKKEGNKEKGSKMARAALVGEEIAQKALAAGIKKVVFDRNFYCYHGRVKALAEAARKAGLNF